MKHCPNKNSVALVIYMFSFLNNFSTKVLSKDTTHLNNVLLLQSIKALELKSTSDEVNVKQFGAKGNGLIDDSQAIQKAINFAKSKNLSTVIFPSGRYLLSKGSITIKQGILLKGIDKVPAKSGFGSDVCQFEIVANPGNTQIPAFIMESFSGIMGFSFLYPNQSNKAVTPTPYGWTITTNGNASQDGITLRNLMLTNTYQGIKLDNGGQHTLENIYGQPIKTGLLVDRQYDVLRINNVHFWPFFSQPGQALYNWIEANGDAIVLNRTDGLQGTNWFAYGYRRGLYLANKGNGAPWVSVNNVLFDVCKEPIVIDDVSYLTLNNVTLTGTNVAHAYTGVLINSSVNDINAVIQLNGLATANLTNSLVNKGVCTITASMKSKIFNGKNNGVRWYDIINENDDALLNITLPLKPGDEYRRVSGKIQINSFFTYQNLAGLTPTNFKWENDQGRLKLIPGGCRFNLLGPISVASYLLPSTIIELPGVYVLEMTVRAYSKTGALGLAAFYPRLRDYSHGIDYPITPYSFDPYFILPTTLKIPFVIDGNSKAFLDIVFGNATNTSLAYIDVTNVKVFRANGTQLGYKELMPVHQNYNRSQLK